VHGARSRYAAGVVNYQDYEGLAECLVSLADQSLPPACVFVADSDPIPELLAALQRRFPAVRWLSLPNRGYGAAANRIIDLVARAEKVPTFVLLLNADVRLEPEFADSVLAEMSRRPDVALASGKLLRPDGVTVDSAGIVRRRSRRFHDRGSESRDRGQFEEVEEVFAVSGAALMLRMGSLNDLEVEGEVFDPDLFLYHEETDLAWRARRLGWKSLYVPRGRAIHRRGWRSRQRFTVPPEIRRSTFRNRYVEMLKNDVAGDVLRDLPFLIAWEAARLGFALLRDPALLGGYLEALRMAPRAWRKRRIICDRVERRASDGYASFG
jgi:GT2 family glycosyltransferase